MSDEYTKDVAKRGLEAVRARRQGQSYSTANRDAALEYMLGSQYGGRQPTQSYQAWQQSRGFKPQQYDIAVGQGDGKYNGFETEGQLKAAVLGRSEALREDDWMQADYLRQIADQYLNDAEGEYTKSLGEGSKAISKESGYNPMQAMLGQFGGMFDGFEGGDGGLGQNFDFIGDLQEKVSRVPEVGYKQQVGEHRGELNEWLGEETAPYLEAVDTAAQIQGTPLRDYATMAGGEYGVDPNIIGGWYPQKSRIDDYRSQRDLEAIDTYGMTDAEFQQFLDQQQRLQDQQAGSEQEMYDQQVSDAIFGVTGMDAGQLAQGADLSVEQLYSVIDSEPYYVLNDQLSQTVASSGEVDEQTIREQVDEVLAQAASDPALYRVLFTQWGGYGGAD